MQGFMGLAQGHNAVKMAKPGAGGVTWGNFGTDVRARV